MRYHDIPRITTRAFPFTPRNIRSGFEVTGIRPFNRDIFTESDFVAASVTDRPFENANEDNPALEHAADDQITDDQLVASTLGTSVVQQTIPEPSTHVTLEQVKPMPRAGPRKELTKGRKRGRTQIITKL